MKNYEILEHKADLKIRAFGKTKEELFSNMLLGMSESQKSEIKDKGENKREIKIKSFDLTSLLVDFLSEVLYLSEINKEVYRQVQFEKLSDDNLEGILTGKKINRMEIAIKGVTYHDLEVKKNEDGGWQAIVLFDI